MFFSFLKKRLLVSLSLLLVSTFSFAESKVDAQSVASISKKMQQISLQVTSIKESKVEGLYEVLTNSGIYYVSKNAQYLIYGSIYDIDNNMKNITESSLASLRQNKLKAFSNDMITYKAANEKHVITVFTDTSCAYCQKLHSEIADYNKLGITVRYLAFPRAGLNSSEYNIMTSIWCASDPKSAMDKAMKRQSLDPKQCANTIKEQYELGLFFGVRGTPAIVLEDGSLKPGYLPATKLLQQLEGK
ncbi:thiol:disulfide interchange protein DsbC [Psychromonas sp. CNPT3]|uniref:bifunctional protein-disulfide isomerase/oxidoreductase DsbC n=1 Tax=Psychromonas sp. CNPT3 TaxID=314282 RepID=UPI00006E5877|nr:bifunctional protein-disulfide isomerase/oxidoreductase DsbC [Psychromonas sp. CNPT3]AGH80403.1 thiol:disulfide interchange protein DsbC [Psychromonas sp. CNPT3]